MFVKELIAELQKLPSDALVLIYNVDEEQDSHIEVVEARMPDVEIDGEFTFISSPHYCKGDSNAQEYWRSNGTANPIVFLRNKYFREV